MGGYPLIIDKDGSQLGGGEPVADTSRVTRMTSGQLCGAHSVKIVVERWRKYATVPVVNALTDDFPSMPGLSRFDDSLLSIKVGLMLCKEKPLLISVMQQIICPTPMC